MEHDPTTDPTRVAALWREAGWLHRVALKLGAEPSAADDLVQETLISASKGAPSEHRTLRRWLRTTLRRRVSTLRRADERRRVREALAAKPEVQSGRGSDPLASLQADELGRVLAEAVAKLPQPDREVLALRYAAGLTPVQIAKSLGSTPGAVSSRLSRALRTLRERLEQQDQRSLGAFVLTLASVVAMKKTTLLCAAALVAIATLPIARHFAALESESVVEPVSQTAELVDLDQAMAAEAMPELGDQPPVDARVMAVGPGLGVSSAEVAEPTVEPAGGSIHVTVTEVQTGDPAPNVGIHAIRFHGGSYWNQKRPLVTDDFGRAALSDLVPGEWHVYLNREAGPGEDSNLVATVGAGGRSDLEFKVDREAVIRGRVMSELGSPVEGAVLRMTEGGGRMAETFAVATSGADGRFLIRYAGAMQMVAASAPGYGSSYATCIAVREAVGKPTEIVLELRTLRGSVHGQVLDGSGAPVSGAKVTVRSASGASRDESPVPKGYWYGPPQVATTGADGGYVFADVSVGPATIYARSATSALFSTKIDVGPGLDHEVAVVLRSGGTVRGQATNAAGEPASGYVITVEDVGSLMSRVETMTDAGGRYELQHLGPGPVGLMVQDDSGNEVANHELVVPDGGSVTWNPVEEARVEIHGDLHAEDGTPLHRWRVMSKAIVDGQVGGGGMGAIASEAGGFSFLPTLSQTFEITVYPPGRYYGKPALHLAEYCPDGEALHFTVPAAEVPSASVHGRLCDPDGEPVAGKVELMAKEPDTRRKLEVGDDGRFHFTYLPESTLELTLTSGAYPKRTVEIHDPLDADEDRDLGDLLLKRE